MGIVLPCGMALSQACDMRSVQEARKQCEVEESFVSDPIPDGVQMSSSAKKTMRQWVCSGAVLLVELALAMQVIMPVLSTFSSVLAQRTCGCRSLLLKAVGCSHMCEPVQLPHASTPARFSTLFTNMGRWCSYSFFTLVLVDSIRTRAYLANRPRPLSVALALSGKSCAVFCCGHDLIR